MNYILLLLISFNLFASSNEYISLNLSKIKVEEFIKIVSKKIDKNIMFVDKIDGELNFVSSKPIKKEKLLELLRYVLKNKGYILKEEDNFLFVQSIKKNILEKKKIIRSFQIKNLSVESLVTILNKLLENKNKSVLDHISISSDKERNILIVSGYKEKIDKVAKFINSIDINSDQVYIKAKIIEISQIRSKELGVKYGLKGFNKYSSNSLTTFSSSLNSLTPNSIDLTEFSLYGFDTSSLSKSLSLAVSINFLKQNEAVDVISEPSILCINNKNASIYVGETRSFKTGQTTNETGTSEAFKREEIGLRLNVKPRVSDNKVIVEINAVLEDANESSSNFNLDTSKKEVITTAVLNNGESVIIGGLIKSKKINQTSKLPFLGDIPILGTLFRNDKNINDKINLVVVLTPYIVPKSLNLTVIKDKLDYLHSLEENYMSSILEKKNNKEKKVHDDYFNEYKKYYENENF